MNSIALMAEVISKAELRYTPENLAVASMLVSFPSGREGEAPFQVRVSSFGDLAQRVSESCQVGDQITVEGQLHIRSVERDGKKEKLAEINARRIYPMTGSYLPVALKSTSPESDPPPPDPTPRFPSETRPSSKSKLVPASEPPDLDEIPF
jgi:single-stranded DNA-binding protein